MKITNAERAALRRAIKTAAEARGETVSDLYTCTKAALLAHAHRLGVDVANVVAGAPTIAAGEVSETGEDGDDTGDTVAAGEPQDEREAAAMRDVEGLLALWRDMDVTGFRDGLTALARRAHAPPVVEIRERIVEVAAPGGAVANVVALAPRAPRAAHPVAKRVGEMTARDLAGVSGPLASLRMGVWDAADAPAQDAHYVWPDATGAILTQLFKRKRPVFLIGPAGTGKTSFAKELAARLKRPFVRISCNAQTEAATLQGMTAPALGGGTEWKDGQLTSAMRRPGCVILIDEPTVARPGALYLLQAVLDSREMHIDETGEVVVAADGVIFILADNTNGTGDHTGQYAGTGQISRATVDRMGASAVVSYLPADSEARVLTAKTGAPLPLAGLLVNFANVTRADNAKGALANAVGLRRLLSWAEMLVDGVGVTEAAELAFLNTSPPDDTETLRQLLRTHCSVALVKRALAGEDVVTATPNASTPEGAAAASTFGQVD